MQGKKKKWYKLDNAAKLYPAIATSRWCSVYRISAVLKEDVAPKTLQQALEHVLPRFPTMAVCLRRGFFWYYFEANEKPLLVCEDTGHPCLRFRWKDNNGYLLRVLFYGRRIAVEFFHALTDGTGAFIFVKTLTAEYLRLRGIRVPAEEGVLDLKRKPSAEEAEDAFNRMPLPDVRVSRRDTRAYRFPGDLEPPHTLHVIAGTLPFHQVHAQSQKLGVTVTEYLVAVMLYATYLEQAKEKRKKPRPIRISVPVNMRAFFPTRTLRNFSSFVNVELDPRLGRYTFEEIAQDVRAYLRYAVNAKRLSATIATNVADERRLILRLCPLPIKNIVVNSVFRHVGERATTTTLTSLGRMNAPKQMLAHIERFEVILGASATPCHNAALVSTGDTMLLTFSRNLRETTLPREVFRFLVEQGISVTIESNQE